LTKTVVVIPGDGIGREVIPVAVKVLKAVAPNIELVEAEAGLETWKRTGETLPEETLELCREADAILFGACTTPEDPSAESPIIRLRRELDLYANVRPARSWPIPRRPIEEDFDFVIVRENTEDLYIGCESEVHPGVTVAMRKISEEGTRRVAEVACDLAEERGSDRVTVVHKANVMKLTCGTFKRVAREVIESRGLEFDECYVDAAAYRMVIDPGSFDVVLTPNMFGDILSDEAAGLMGSLGLAPSGNVGDDHGLSVHGSAPDIAGKGIANPMAAILSAAMMLEWLGMREEAEKVEEAVERTIEEGVITPDLGGNASTEEVGEKVLEKLEP